MLLIFTVKLKRGHVPRSPKITANLHFKTVAFYRALARLTLLRVTDSRSGTLAPSDHAFRTTRAALPTVRSNGLYRIETVAPKALPKPRFRSRIPCWSEGDATLSGQKKL